jgi:hypothetical protein
MSISGSRKETEALCPFSFDFLGTENCKNIQIYEI